MSKSEDYIWELSSFEDKPHRCPRCWRVDYNVVSYFGGRVILGSCPDDSCWTKWYGLRLRTFTIFNFLRVQDPAPLGVHKR